MVAGGSINIGFGWFVAGAPPPQLRAPPPRSRGRPCPGRGGGSVNTGTANLRTKILDFSGFLLKQNLNQFSMCLDVEVLKGTLEEALKGMIPWRTRYRLS